MVGIFKCLCAAVIPCQAACGMTTIREVLNELKWSTARGLSDCEVVILHRGAPGDRKVISGACIKDVAPRALVCEDGGEETLIPYHRVRLIRKGTKTVWAKPAPAGAPPPSHAGGRARR